MDTAGIVLNVQKGIDGTPDDVRGNYSDGYHTFNDLYEHRIRLFIQLCQLKVEMQKFKHLYKHYNEADEDVWCSKAHSDGKVWDGWFILGIGYKAGEQITYHLNSQYWEEVSQFAKVLPKAPTWDGHTSADVLERLKRIF